MSLEKAICIATSRQDDEPVYQELLRTAETGEPYLLEIDLERNKRKRRKISLAQARKILREWEISQQDIEQEF